MLAALAVVVIDHVSGFLVHEVSSVMTGFDRVWFVDDTVLDAIAGEALRRGGFSQRIYPICCGQSSQEHDVPRTLEFCRCQAKWNASWIWQKRFFSIFRKLSRLQTALSLHDQLLGVCGSAPRRERFRLQLRSKEEGCPLQIANGTLLMEAERHEDVALSVRLFESLARSVRSAWRLPEHNSYALEFIKAVTEVEAEMPLHRKAPGSCRESSWR